MPERFKPIGFDPRDLQRATATRKDPQSIIEELSKENKILSEAIANSEKEMELLQKQASGANTSQKEINSLKLELADLQKTVSSIKQQNIQLEATNKRLLSQASDQTIKALSPEEGSALISRTIDSIANVKNFKLVDANVKLKLATAKVGDQGTLVFPSPDSKIDPGTLQEINFKIVRDVPTRL